MPNCTFQHVLDFQHRKFSLPMCANSTSTFPLHTKERTRYTHQEIQQICWERKKIVGEVLAISYLPVSLDHYVRVQSQRRLCLLKTLDLTATDGTVYFHMIIPDHYLTKYNCCKIILTNAPICLKINKYRLALSQTQISKDQNLNNSWYLRQILSFFLFL